MKFCYIDESGIGGQDFAVMSGIIVDARRMHVTKDHWDDLLTDLSKLVEREVEEIHTVDFYPGNSPWRDLDGDTRSAITTEIFNWLRDRKHNVVYSSVDVRKFNRHFDQEEFSGDISSLWQFLALHLCLSIQRCHQRISDNKGHTILIFDNEDVEAKRFLDLVRDPPKWTDTYYECIDEEHRLDQIIDVPYFGDSKHVGLIQLADFVSFFLRRYLELFEGGEDERYEGESNLVKSWIEVALERSIPRSNIYLQRGRCDCSDLFYRFAPDLLSGVV
jgi:hypothetical protein